MRHFGGRRRQCTNCKRTWRIRRKHRGRKRHRISGDFAIKYLDRLLPSFYALHRKEGASADKLEYRLRKSRDWFIRHTPWPELPEGPLIAVADAKMKNVSGVMYSTYIILVRSVAGTHAVPLPPYLETGRESIEGWSRAFARLPHAVEARIEALVCDGHRGLICNAMWRQWRIQRCQFHLLQNFSVRRSRNSMRGNKEVGKRLITLAHILFGTEDRALLLSAVSELEAIGWASKRGTLRTIIAGFVNHLDEYRTYLSSPELRLPRTSNTAESFISGLQKLCADARGFRTRSSFEKWIEAYVKYKKTIRCRPGLQPNYFG